METIAERGHMKNTGGQAFPALCYTPTEGYATEGMTLRDYFAAKTLQSLLSDKMPYRYDMLAQTAYDVADAMIAERSKV